MKDFYICNCASVENQTITSFFVVASKQVRSKKNGDVYLSLVLADRSGQLQANMWENVNDAIDGFDQDDFVKVKGVIHKYNGRWQVTIHKLRKLSESEVDYADYLPKTAKDVEQLWRTLGEFVASFENPWLKRLIGDFMADETIATAYKTAPAAKTLHHAFVGGLLDHVVSLFTLCDLTVRNYPQVNRDLLMTGAFFHDIGKLHELAYQRAITYTTKGQLLGHMIIELEMLHDKLADVPGFPDELKILIEHLIISHHGQYEFGSPKLPMFPEALMLHYLDDLDSKMESMRAQFERESDFDSAWTSYNPSLARPLLNTQKFLNRQEQEKRETETAAENAPTPHAEAGEPEMKSAAETKIEAPPAPPNGDHAPMHQPQTNDSGHEAVGVVAEPSGNSLEALQRHFAAKKVTAGSKPN